MKFISPISKPGTLEICIIGFIFVIFWIVNDY